MSYQKNIREQITNRCSRIAKLVKLNAAAIILENEQRQLHQLLGQYEQNDIVSEPKFEKDSDEEHNAWVDYCLSLEGKFNNLSLEEWRKING